jgi:hypothetical protein
MAFRITVIDSAGAKPRTYTAIGDRNALMDAAYDSGAMGVTVLGASLEKLL